MQLTQAADYALRAVLYLVKRGSDEIVPAQMIAGHEQIPMRFLLKIMRVLIQAGIIKSHRGVEGGYSLARPPETVTLLDVVEAVEGPVMINRCLIAPEYCNKDATGYCEIHHALAKIQGQLIQELGRHNFRELAGRRAD